jgi:hypothetical protein
VAAADPAVKDLQAIVALYNELDGGLDQQLSSARSRGDRSQMERIERKRRLNDQAFFVLAWGQLETAITEACRNVIRAGRSHADWRVRRIWELYDPDDRRLSGLRFEDSASLVLDRSTGKGGPFAMTVEHYAIRNQIAHGAFRPDRIDLSSVAQDFYAIEAALQP